MSIGLELFRIGFLRVTLLDLFDILIISFLLYRMYMVLRGSRAAQMAIGLVLILIVSVLTQLLSMTGISWIVTKLETVWLIAFVVLFQPELRRLLVYLGQNRLVRFFITVSPSRSIDEIVKAAQELSRLHYGALIVVARENTLKPFVETGIKLQAQVSAPLLLSLFSPKSPLHDGAIIIENDEIVAAKAILPLTQSDAIDKRYGTRHRAALGLSEESDAVTIVVSEETGRISIAKEGSLIRDLTTDEAQQILTASLNQRSEK